DVLLRARGDGDAGAFGGERLRGCETDAFRAAGNENDLVFQSEIHAEDGTFSASLTRRMDDETRNQDGARLRGGGGRLRDVRAGQGDPCRRADADLRS